MATRYFALIFGIVYLLVGILGFVPGLLTPAMGMENVTVDANYGLLFGLFPVNVLHNIVHAVIGLAGIIAFRTFAASRTYAAVVAVIFAVLTIMGLIPALNTTFGLIPLFGNDVWLHAVTAIVAAVFALLPERSRAQAVSRQPCPGTEPC